MFSFHYVNVVSSAQIIFCWIVCVGSTTDRFSLQLQPSAFQPFSFSLSAFQLQLSAFSRVHARAGRRPSELGQAVATAAGKRAPALEKVLVGLAADCFSFSLQPFSLSASAFQLSAFSRVHTLAASLAERPSAVFMPRELSARPSGPKAGRRFWHAAERAKDRLPMGPSRQPGRARPAGGPMARRRAVTNGRSCDEGALAGRVWTG